MEKKDRREPGGKGGKRKKGRKEREERKEVTEGKEEKQGKKEIFKEVSNACFWFLIVWLMVILP